MSLKEYKWSQSEKKIARKAFDVAYQREMEEIRGIVNDRVQRLNKDKDLWELHDFLTERRDSVDERYDYRYSRLILVFGMLMRDEYLLKSDLVGLDEDKISAIIRISEYDY